MTMCVLPVDIIIRMLLNRVFAERKMDGHNSDRLPPRDRDLLYTSLDSVGSAYLVLIQGDNPALVCFAAVVSSLSGLSASGKPYPDIICSVIVASTLHAKYVGEWQTSKFDPIAAVTPFIWLQVETSYAIMSATFPTLGTVLKSLNTRWGALDGPDVAQYAMSSLSRSRDGAKNGISSRSRRETDSGPPRLRPEGGGYTFRVRNQQQEVSSGLARKNSDDSDQMIIRKTVSTSVEHQGLG